ncbi:MAG: NADH-quinone oxidoreductase subunit J [Nitrospirota bacterium]
MNLDQAFFLYFAAMIVVFSIVTITRKNPVYAVMALLVVFFHVAGLYVLLNAEFIAALQVVVYAGAILVLYLFVLMLLSVPREALGAAAHRRWPVYALVGGATTFEIALLLARSKFAPRPGPYPPDVVREMGSTQAIGTVLFTEFLYPFEVISLVLLVAMIGAIVLTKKWTPAQGGEEGR